MPEFVAKRSPSLTMVVLVLMAIVVLQNGVSYTTAFGRLNNLLPGFERGPFPRAWFAFRAILILILVVLWLLNRRAALFKAIIAVNAIFTLGLLGNMTALTDALFHMSAAVVRTLLFDVVLLAVSNILIFSIWYWIIDPPGVEEPPRTDEPWDFLFPQRGGDLPRYEGWQPRYSDYLYVAFTTSFAFSPTDTLPLTRRAKMLMLLQSTVSIITLTAIAGSAINILAGSA